MLKKKQQSIQVVKSAAVRTGASIAVGFIPGIGEAYDIASLITGKDMITGQRLSTADKVLTAVGLIIPGVSGAHLKAAGKVVKAAAPAVAPAAKKAVTAVAGFVGGLIGKSSKVTKGAGEVKNKPFVPDEYWKRNAPDFNTPGSKITHLKDNKGVIEKSTVIYDDFGRQKWRIDYNNHGYSDHSIPHLHERVFGPGLDPEFGKEIRYDWWR